MALTSGPNWAPEDRRKRGAPRLPELVLQLTRAGFLALLWLFVLVALRVVRSDLYAASGLRAVLPGRVGGGGPGATSRPGS